MTKNYLSKEGPKKRVPWNKGKRHSEATKLKISSRLQGRKSWNEGLSWKDHLGSNNPNWRGGEKLCSGCHKPIGYTKEKLRCRRCEIERRRRSFSEVRESRTFTVPCASCGKEFRQLRDRGRYAKLCCTLRCASIYTHLVHKTKKKGTQIEVAMEEFLKSLGVEFFSQHAFPRVCIPDFYVPRKKVAIFCDGDYWHKYPHGTERDHRQSKELTSLGVTVFRVWEREIKGKTERDWKGELTKLLKRRRTKSSLPNSPT